MRPAQPPAPLLHCIKSWARRQYWEPLSSGFVFPFCPPMWSKEEVNVFAGAIEVRLDCLSLGLTVQRGFV